VRAEIREDRVGTDEIQRLRLDMLDILENLR